MPLKSKYTPRERINAILAGEQPDRFAASFWRHFFHRENSAEGTAAAMVDFQRKFEWDFVKINPRADYHIEGWGFRHKFSTDEFTKHTKLDFPIKQIEDWNRVKPLPLSTPALEEQLRTISLIRKKIDRAVPILMTVFSPLGVAGRMVQQPQILREHLDRDPELVNKALEAVAATFEKFISEARNAGADGIFYATLKWASRDMMTWGEYEKLGLPYDGRLMEAAGGDALNVFHVCHTSSFLEELSRYQFNCRMYNWDSAHPTNLPLDKGLRLLKNKAVVGGVDHEGWLRHCDAEEIGYKMAEIRERFDASQLIIGPGCAIPPETPETNLFKIRESL